ncbi:SDR family NAD(P)-dependent oxidoreductase [Microbacterium sp. RD1]|uniref:SDR family NAD(P)-dependent oxidoreductase n=1 Tax=Microbacterium sp. RD1 TaxID=3457313 RepID=UPI003FA56AEC
MPVAVIIGGSAGIGQAAAMDLARRGFGVIVTYRRHPEGAADVVTAVEEWGLRAAALPLDLADASAFPAFADRVREVLSEVWDAGAFEVLVHNAGVGGAEMLGEITQERYELLHRVLLKGPVFLTQALVPMLADGGSVIYTTSTSTNAAGISPGYAVYGAMKGGLVVLTRYFAKELAPRGIRVNSVSPGPTRTRFGDDAYERFPEVVAPLAERSVFGRLGEPDDVGAVIAFLAGRESRWITGQDIDASGGYDL